MLAAAGLARPDRPARRQVVGGARAARGACTGAGACRGALPHLCARGGRPCDGADDRRQCEDAPHRHLRRHRDPADRLAPSPLPCCPRSSRICGRWAAIFAPMRRRATSCPTCRRRTMRISIPSGWTRCCPLLWWMASMPRWRISPGMAANTLTPSSPTNLAAERFLRRPGRRCRVVERLHAVLRRWGVRVRRGDRHRHRPHPCARPGRAGAIDHCIATSCAARARCVPERACRLAAAFRRSAAHARRLCSVVRSIRRMWAIVMLQSWRLRRLRLDQVWLLVSPGNPLKSVRRHGARWRCGWRRRADIADGRRVLATAIEASAEHALHHRHAAGVAAAVSSGAVCLADGRRHSAAVAALAALAGIRAHIPLAVLPRPGYTRRALAGQAALDAGCAPPHRAATTLARSSAAGLGVIDDRRKSRSPPPLFAPAKEECHSQTAATSPGPRISRSARKAPRSRHASGGQDAGDGTEKDYRRRTEVPPGDATQAASRARWNSCNA